MLIMISNGINGNYNVGNGYIRTIHRAKQEMETLINLTLSFFPRSIPPSDRKAVYLKRFLRKSKI